MATLEGKDHVEKFDSLRGKRHAQQAKWFINTYYDRAPLNLGKNPDVLEEVFQSFLMMVEIDPKHSKGSSLDQWQSHRFLEKMGSTVTWTAFEDMFKTLDVEYNKKLSLTEYYLFKFGKEAGREDEIKKLVNASQAIVKGLEEAEENLAQAMDAHEKAKEELAKVIKLQLEIAAFKKRYDAITADFEKKISEATSMVKKNKYKSELGDHLSGARARRKKITELDPDKLNQLEIDMGAAVRKGKAAAKLVRKKFKAAKAQVEKIKEAGKSGAGLLWWLDRNLQEEEKYMSKKQFAKKKAKLAAKKKKLVEASKDAK